MSLHDHYTLPSNDQQDVDAGWFDTQFDRWNPDQNKDMCAWRREEIEALKAFHDGTADAKETADMITRPISTSPVPSLGTYSDETTALIELWMLLITALMEWPSDRTPRLFALLREIGGMPDEIHRGEATDSEGKEKLTWSTHPYLGTVWYNTSLSLPGVIVRPPPDAAALEKIRATFVKQKDIEAQLWAGDLIGRDEDNIIEYITKTLEATLQKSVATDNETAEKQIWLEFHVPAVDSWMRYAGPRILRKKRVVGSYGRSGYNILVSRSRIKEQRQLQRLL